MPSVNLSLSCVATLYKSREFVSEFVHRMHTAASKITDQFEIILVDDGSPDDSLEIAIRLQSDFPQLRVVQLSRNFGHHAAILAGLNEAKGDLIFLIDSDLEEAPELAFHFWKALDGDVDVVFGVHDRRGKSWLDRVTGHLFWTFIRSASKTNIERNLANVRLMRRAYVDALLSMPDRNIFLGGMFSWPGFSQVAMTIDRKERSTSSYAFSARVRLALVAAISFSHRPLLFIFFVGMAISAFSMLAGLYFIVVKLLYPESVVSGYTSIIVSLWLIGGLVIGAIGLLGFYVAHIYEQTRDRPRYIIKRRYETKR